MGETIPGRTLALNEWLFADVTGENSSANQLAALKFLEVFADTPDRIVWPRASPWENKFYQLSKNADRSPMVRKAVILLLKRIRLDSMKAVIIDVPHCAALDPAVADGIPKEDHYLVQAALAARAEVLVSTDNKLLDAISRANLPLAGRHRDEFLAEYSQGRNVRPVKGKSAGGS